MVQLTAMVTRPGSPPNAAMLSRTHSSAKRWSSSPTLRVRARREGISASRSDATRWPSEVCALGRERAVNGGVRRGEEAEQAEPVLDADGDDRAVGPGHPLVHWEA